MTTNGNTQPKSQPRGLSGTEGTEKLKTELPKGWLRGWRIVVGHIDEMGGVTAFESGYTKEIVKAAPELVDYRGFYVGTTEKFCLD